jgi:hypothetical protein
MKVLARYSFFNLSPDERLGLVRILFFGALVFSINFDHLTSFVGLALDIKCSQNMGIWYFFEFSKTQMSVLKYVCMISAVTSCIGFFTRLSYWLCFLSLLFLNMYALKFCFWNHVYLPLHFPMLFWALLDRNSTFRVDQFLKIRFLNSKSSIDSTDFLVKANRVFFAIIFFAAGYSKLKNGGLDWIFSSSLQNILYLQNFLTRSADTPELFVKLNHWLIQFPKLCSFLALDTILIELITPIALFSKRAQKYIILHLIVLQFGFYVFTYINFLIWLLIYLFWLPLLKEEPTVRMVIAGKPT